ncbi:hypothetical protein F5Y16DRAFT_399563 [Xylariaceae sp. FL0255]|nr:hypothetical protein F5Y16DRAFT_399563 [Xylariaceae sp. FL0255]
MSSSSSNDHGFSLPPPGFNPEEQKQHFADLFQQINGDGSLPVDGASEESIEDEIARTTKRLEDIRNRPLTKEEQDRIADGIHTMRQGGWLAGVKLVLEGQKHVPIEWFNRLVGQHEATIPYLAQKLSSVTDKTLQDERDALKAQLNERQQHNKELEDKLKKAEKENQATTDDKGLIDCQDQVAKLQAQLAAAHLDLQTARDTASRFYDENENLRQQLANQNVVKDEARRLRADNEKGDKEVKRLNDEIQSLKMQLAAAQHNPTNTNSPPAGSGSFTPENGPVAQANSDAGLQARIDELTAQVKVLANQRDYFKDKWVTNFVKDDANLREFYTAVETSRGETRQFYKSLDVLGQALGMADKGLSPAEMLDDILKTVTVSTANHTTLQLQKMQLKFSLLNAELDNQLLQDQLDAANNAQTDDQIKLALGIVEEEEVERRVAARTQTYKNYQRQLIDHMLNARTAFRDHAESIGFVEGTALNLLVDRFLEVSTLPVKEQ